jgi:hypothetical protein
MQRVCDPRQGSQGEVYLPALDLLPVPPMDSSAVRDFFERQARLLAQPSRIGCELLADLPLRRGEARHTATLLSLGH